ncbi:ABC transporter permease subunit [Sphaerochaeta sp. PS]|uniref:ABC transporter permease n=1 Tax=Sphaerochaeta sp. PS TaxID=3076336 RepID=UPI0028A2FB00|nr:ABC transporter permease subunit [Sphaerochaeta sp. PS]MDT4762174.1 ABC transporter permease subunit [Sphaerochaeta sp. PS]
MANKQLHKKATQDSLLKDLIKYRWIYILALPGLLYLLVFKYVPMYGVTVAFKDYSSRLGILQSPWVGMKHFMRLFASRDFAILLKNTLFLNVYKIAVMTPLAMVFALCLNAIRNVYTKRIMQTISYFPHFLSWVVISGITFQLFSPYSGTLNQILIKLGMQPMTFLSSPKSFKTMLVVFGAWKELGWASIIYLAALSGINTELYEAAQIDGASKLRKTWHITMPALIPTMVTLLLIDIGRIMSVGFEQVYVYLNPILYEKGDVFATYVYRVGLGQGKFSYTTAVELFNTMIGLVLLVVANKISKRLTEESLW